MKYHIVKAERCGGWEISHLPGGGRMSMVARMDNLSVLTDYQIAVGVMIFRSLARAGSPVQLKDVFVLLLSIETGTLSTQEPTGSDL